MSSLETILYSIDVLVQKGELKPALNKLLELETSGMLEKGSKQKFWEIFWGRKSKNRPAVKDFESSPLIWSLILKSNIFIGLNQRKQALDTAQKALTKALATEKQPALIIDAYTSLANILSAMGNCEESQKAISDGLAIIEEMDSKDLSGHQFQLASLLLARGKCKRLQGLLREALDDLQKSLDIFRALEDKKMIAEVLLRQGIVYYYLGSLENAQDSLSDCLKLFQELENKPNLARVYNTIGAVYYAKGEFTHAIENYEQSLKMKKEIGNKQEIAITLNNLGAIFRDQGETEKAYAYLSKSFDLFIELGNDQYSAYNLMYLLLTSIDLEDIQQAEEYLSSIELIAHRNPNNIGIDHKFRLCRAIYLKASARDRNKGRAEEILSSIIRDEISDKEVAIYAMIHLCDLLIEELRMTEDQSILREIEKLTKQLRIFAKEQYSHSIIASTALLQAKLELLELNIEAAKRLLVQAELIAQEYGLKLLEQKISAEFDSLLNHEKDWIEAKGKPISFTELMDLAAIDDSIRIMVNKKKLQAPSFEIEEPVMLLIAKSNGISIYSKIFREFDLKSDFNEQLFGGFLSALNDFSDEVFSRRLNRARLGEFNLVLQPFDDYYLLCYIFKGSTYPALKKLEQMINLLKRNKTCNLLFKRIIDSNQLLKPDELQPIEKIVKSVFSLE